MSSAGKDRASIILASACIGLRIQLQIRSPLPRLLALNPKPEKSPA